MTAIGYGAFGWCSDLAVVTMPSSLESVGTDAFQGCNDLERVNIASIASWCAVSFGADSANPLARGSTYDKLYVDDKLVHDLVIPDGVTAIGDWAFCCCEGFTSVTVPDSVTSIGDYAFYHCEGLTSVTVPDNVTAIGEGAFFHCEGLTSVTVGNGVTAIGDWAFSCCEGLASVTIPVSVTSIGKYAFKDCTSLTDVYYKGTDLGWAAVTKGNYWDSDNSALHVYYVTTITSGVASLTKYGGPESEVTVPSELDGYPVQGIDNDAFKDNTTVTAVTIPESVTSIGNNAFPGCENLASVAVAEGNQKYTAIDGVLYELDAGSPVKMVFCPCAYAKTSLTLPDSVGEIVLSAYYADLIYIFTDNESLLVSFASGDSSEAQVLTFDRLDTKSRSGNGQAAVTGIKHLGVSGAYSSLTMFVPCDGIAAPYAISGVNYGTGNAYEYLNYSVKITITHGGDLDADGVHAYCTSKKYTVTFYSNDGSGEMDPQLVEGYVEAAIDPNAFTRTGYDFTGWNTKKDGTGGGYEDKGVIASPIADVDLYAQWKAIKYTVTFLDCDNTVLQSGLVAYDSTPVYNGEAPVKAANGDVEFTFVGWSPKIAPVSGNNEYKAKFGIATELVCSECGEILYLDPDLTTDTHHYGCCFNPNCSEYGVPATSEAHGGTATCTVKAVCPVCGVEHGDFDADNHVIVDRFPAVAATCTADGKIEFWHCPDCGRYYSDKACTSEVSEKALTVKKIGHKNKLHYPADEATCVYGGNTEYWYCPDCKEYYSDEGCTAPIDLGSTVIEKTGHIFLVHHAAVAPTCTEDGNIEYWYCKDCGNRYSDEACTVQVNRAGTVAPKLGHGGRIYTAAKAATCTEDGNIEYWYCPDCGCYYSDEACTVTTAIEDTVIAKTNHANKSHAAAKAPTCTEDGNTEYWYCPDCGCCYSDEACTVTTAIEDTVIAKTNHANRSHTAAKAPTCTDTGSTGYWYCPDCRGFYSDEACTAAINPSDTVIAALGHDWDEGKVTIPATCTEDGEITFTCRRSDSNVYHIYIETIKAKGHTAGEPETENAVAPGCTSAGSFDVVTRCSVCGAEISRLTVTTAALGHDFGEWAVTVPVSCTENGVETRVCSRDHSHTETRLIGASGHVFGEWTVTVAPTETEAGVKTRVCSVCGGKETEKIPALGSTDPVIYGFAAEPEKDWKCGSGKDFVLISEAKFEIFVGAKIDGKYLDKAFYTAEEGSTKVTFKAEYLETLSPGEHVLTVVSEDGEASATVTVIAADPDNPDTPEETDKPDTPDVPGETDKPDETENTEATGASGGAETSDTSEDPGSSSAVVWVVIAVAAAALAAFIILFAVRKKNK
ncbi:MAG: leucine-rich repeat protein [Clostridia bacterium]|nr:leucine-rich repeat protein [Clostridia bacterium]